MLAVASQDSMTAAENEILDLDKEVATQHENLYQGLLWETSLLDPEEGIRFRGYSIPELQV